MRPVLLSSTENDIGSTSPGDVLHIQTCASSWLSLLQQHSMGQQQLLIDCM